MLSFTDMVRDVLPPTRTYHLREFIFIPADAGNRGEDGLGRLTLKLQFRKGGRSSKRHNYAYDLDSYLLDDGGVEPGDDGGRGYFLQNLTDPDSEDVYRCVVGVLKPKCNCKASKCQVRDESGELVCKHYSALVYLTEAGIV